MAGADDGTECGHSPRGLAPAPVSNDELRGAREVGPAEADDSSSFLHALARRMNVRLVALVPTDRPVRVVWFTPRPTRDAADEVAELESFGRELLAGRATSTAAEPPSAAEAHTADHAHFATTPVPAAPGERIGMVVAAKDPGVGWSGAERALLEFAVEFYAATLARCARRPHPQRTTGGRLAPRAAGEDDLASTMRTAADRGELFLAYQPEIDLGTGAVVAVEALARWSHPERGELGPDSFIALAEQSDLIRVLGAWVVEESLRDFAAWQRAVPDLDIALRVNVSPAQLTDGSFVAALRAALARHGVPGQRLCLELTENLTVIDVDRLVGCLHELHEMGVSIALDDLASGYSSLGRLRAIPVQYVKIDRSLVAGVDADVRARTIVRSVLQLAAELDAGVIAEGVETAAETDTLRELGCTRAQGHYFGRPMAEPDLLARLRDHGGRETGAESSDNPSRK